ncbi:hypothetical protein [Desulfobaculum senezii]
MQFEGALIKEQGVTFAIVVVKQHVLNNSTQREDVQRQFTHFFQNPVVLMAQNSRGRHDFWGRQDLVDFLVNVPVSSIPWKKYTISN